MTTYVISVPGTFTGTAGEEVRARVARSLRPADPHRTQMGDEEDLDVLSVNDDGTFTVRLTVDAATGPEAERQARRLAEDALADAGLDERAAPLGPAVITGIDSGV
ncbi:hypothetical protein AB0E75_04460 [Streptomyces griseoviridis]|jgi:hypothetical protein|uniref:Uncharacterized protein n=3 Tax=Streptomyces TaxID=1883 RepID=A0ABT9LRC7_STRGD|nr:MULTISPECIES: hypothetical protein [Streptomyces]MDP9686101.1 hypothetical protein [Streptomyces griseoviridis]GGS46334.1 hypothetical protein GCM10010238_40120 [Streptomyces niveoruber]GGS79376.1 hypothetical protein GCM10010240_10890 [Streptomyces griseoviridis]GGU16793.1 hypothetical protein GCM10010259_04060 [Streptomyces daghestanicus]GHI35387.1 hypothetical protein Sdagh_71170 [Streptomyces daghestanicus]